MFHIAKLIKTNNQLYLYDSLCNRIAPVPASFVSKNGTINKNKHDKFIKEQHFRDCTQPTEFNISYGYTDSELLNLINNRMSNIMLSLTEQCNLRCKYCAYIDKYSQGSALKEMNRGVAFNAIDLLMKHSSQADFVFVDFYGGEPLLKFDLIKECIDYCKKRYPFTIPRYQITTNGLLLGSNDVIEFLVKNEFQITISLDGPKSIQDRYRLQKNGQVSFDRVFENITKLYKYSPQFFKEHVVFNAVVGPTTGTVEQYEFLENLCKTEVILIDCNITDYFSKVIAKELLTSENETINAQNHTLMKKTLLKSMQKYHDALSSPSWQHHIFPGGFCIPGTRKNFITADGKIIVCEKVDEKNSSYQVGDVFNGIDIHRVKELVTETISKTQRCKTCWAAKFCNICFKDIFNLTDEFCEKTRNRIERELAYYLDNIKDSKKLTNYLENLSIE